MFFDGPYPSYSGSMERVIHDALSSPNHEDVDGADVLPASDSVHKSNFKFPRYIRAWLRSRPILKRLRSFGNQPENGSTISCSASSIPSSAADDILDRLPEGDSSIGELAHAIRNMENFSTTLEDSDSATETTCMSPCGSLMNSPGVGIINTQNMRAPPARFPGAVRGRNAGMEICSRTGNREKKEVKPKKRYLEVHDGVWDSAVGAYIPNAWPAPGFGVKTAIRKPIVSRKGRRS
ncbi:hypothetical protein TWF481_005096 [Arthrobotrys musiformis]|uniref:Uncharacterized protein n=1 Tax=Arthrobotrys musiformis TaxID=47236 RepID=A0AAV9WCP1_9PEZI